MTLRLRTSSKQGILQPSRLDIRILCERQANFKKNFSVFAQFFEKKKKKSAKAPLYFTLLSYFIIQPTKTTPSERAATRPPARRLDSTLKNAALSRLFR
jgi:hypothetical protein